ncbi:MAG: phenylalanine--tRNA ligase subunit alpha [Candidatus Shikimatogenerans bostrichidophilus]|nr:MAG: phenylalanine--tRNA ligase subunit alpha [Candidatus Shikimatogenerans bostrichidophilus]
MKNINKYIKRIKKIKKKKIKIKNLIKFKKKYLNKNGIINYFLNKIKIIKNKKKLGIKINLLKKNVLLLLKKNKKYKQKKIIINKDFFYKTKKKKIGSLHPITLIKNKIISLFNNINFKFINFDKNIINDWYNFESLNFPKYHPSRDMQDTFYINKKYLLKTHTTSIQIKYIKKHKIPIKIITSGKVFRNESISKKSFFMFNQIEILYVNKYVSIIDLKDIIKFFIINMFKKKIKYRFRISYFPFTKPSFEVDILYKNKWIEILGCGIINKKIFKNAKLSKKIKGLAIGIGIERIAMIIYNIKDIRTFYINDIRFLKQFKYNF